MGQSNERGDGGIYIGSIMKGGAVAADGRIEPGDMLLQVPLSTVAGGEDRELGRCTLCTLTFFLLYIQRPLLGGGRPPDPPSCPNACPYTAAYPTPGPFSQVNEINFENMSNDDAVRVLREIVHKPGYGWDGALQRRGRHSGSQARGSVWPPLGPPSLGTPLLPGPSP